MDEFYAIVDNGKIVVDVVVEHPLCEQTSDELNYDLELPPEIVLSRKDFNRRRWKNHIP